MTKIIMKMSMMTVFIGASRVLNLVLFLYRVTCHGLSRELSHIFHSECSWALKPGASLETGKKQWSLVKLGYLCV